MARLAFLRKKSVLALLALALGVGALGGFSFYNWHKDESLGVDGRKDGCAAAIAVVGDQAAYSMAITDESPRAMKTLLAAQPFYLREGDVSIPGTPVLAHPIRMHTGTDFSDCPHWLLPEFDAAGHLVAMVDYVYDDSHKLARFSAAGLIFPNDPRFSNPFPYLSAEQAIALLKRARGVDTLRQPAPELVFLPIDLGLPEKHGPAWGWQGGGAIPSDPIWLLAGADGRDYFIGADERVYTLHDLPLS